LGYAYYYDFRRSTILWICSLDYTFILAVTR
jgi:hypothetical protein